MQVATIWLTGIPGAGKSVHERDQLKGAKLFPTLCLGHTVKYFFYDSLMKIWKLLSLASTKKDSAIMNIAEFRKMSVPICQAHKRFNKVFGIGENKTGTTTLQEIFNIIGLNVAPQLEGELCGFQAYQGVLADLKRYIENYDAFQDAPFSIKTTFAQVDALFPSSKFILTYREPEAWFNSLLNFHKKIFHVDASIDKPSREDMRKFLHPYPEYVEVMSENHWLIDIDEQFNARVNWDLLYMKNHYVDLYVERNKSIVRHFSARKSDLLVIDITKEKDTSKIVEFLGLPSSLITAVPHLNKT